MDEKIRKCFTEMGEFDPEFQLFDIEETIGNLKALIDSYSREAVKDALDIIAQNEGWEDSRDYYAAKFGLPYKYVDRFHKALEANHE